MGVPVLAAVNCTGYKAGKTRNGSFEIVTRDGAVSDQPDLDLTFHHVL